MMSPTFCVVCCPCTIESSAAWKVRPGDILYNQQKARRICDNYTLDCGATHSRGRRVAGLFFCMLNTTFAEEAGQNMYLVFQVRHGAQRAHDGPRVEGKLARAQPRAGPAAGARRAAHQGAGAVNGYFVTTPTAPGAAAAA